MIILGIDSSSRCLTAGLLLDNKVITENNRTGLKCSDAIFLLISSLLKKAKIKLNQIDSFAVGLGPGSFTGLRIGLATIKGFCFALNKKAIGIPSLDTIALNVNPKGRLVIPIVDAKRSLVYSALYDYRDKELMRKSRYLLVTIGQVLDRIKRPGIFLGDGLNIYRDAIIKKSSIIHEFANEEFWFPRAENLLKIAKQKYEKVVFDDYRRLTPIYLYPKECQIVKNA